MSAISSLPSNELVGVCLRTGTSECWEEFVRRFQPAIALAVLRTARSWHITSAARIEDIVQDVFLKLCADDYRLLRVFVPQQPDSIFGYLKILAANTTRDLLRAQNATKRGGRVLHTEDCSMLDRLPAPTGGRGADIEWSLQLREIDDTLQSLIPKVLTERDHFIFGLYFHQGFSARDISLIGSIGLTEKGVESAIHRTSREIRAVLGGKIGAEPKGIGERMTLSKEEP